MAELTLDTLVIGFGKAGKTIAMTRGAAGDRVAIIEQDPAMYGGTCINIACVPTKTLLFEAGRSRFEDARDRRNGFIAQLNAANTAMVDQQDVMIIDGRAELLDARTVRVTGGDDELTITADTIIINTGSTPNMPDVPGVDSPRVVDFVQAQQFPARPDHLVIVGAGPIGLEFATMYAKFGARVTLLDAGERLLPDFDADIAAAVEAQLGAQGVTIVHDARADRFTDRQDGITVHFGDDVVTADHALVAIGRSPATAGLGAEAAGLTLGDGGAIVVDEHCHTGLGHVYAAGDVNGGPQYTYVSYDDHRVILSHRWGDGSRTTAGRLVQSTTFTDPPLSTVGPGEDEARRIVEGRGHTLDVRASDIADIAIMPRPKIVRQPAGRAKILVDREADRIVGATLYCVDSQELINFVTLAMRHGIPASAVGSGIYTHPSSTEVFNALLA